MKKNVTFMPFTKEEECPRAYASEPNSRLHNLYGKDNNKTDYVMLDDVL